MKIEKYRNKMKTGVSQLNTSATHEINARASDCVIGYGHELIHGICCNVNIDTDSTHVWLTTIVTQYGKHHAAMTLAFYQTKALQYKCMIEC